MMAARGLSLIACAEQRTISVCCATSGTRLCSCSLSYIIVPLSIVLGVAALSWTDVER